MKFRLVVLASSMLARFTLAELSGATQSQGKSNVTYIPNTYIVELEPHAENALRAAHRFDEKVGSSIQYNVRREFNNPQHFYGLSLTITDGTNQSSLQNAEGVKNVWRVAIVPRPQSFLAVPSASKSASVNATIPHITGTSDVNNPLRMGAVIDTGVDYLHPSLGGCFGPGCKVSFGFDLVGDEYRGYNEPVPDDDPLATCTGGGHGTHVAGTIGMVDRANEGFGLVGVAPEVTLGMYRIFGCAGGASDDVIVEAMLRAADDGADVMSLSLGSLVYWEQATPYPSLVTSLVNSGVAVVVAAGNDGTAGPFAVSAPALSPDALSVGSVENTIYPTVYNAQDNFNETVDYVSVFPLLRDLPLTLFWLGSNLGHPNNSTFSDGCYFPAWQAAQEAIDDPENTAILIALDGQCSPGVYGSLLNDMGISIIVYYTDIADRPIVMQEPGASGQFTFIMLDYQTSQKLTRRLSELSSGQTYAWKLTDPEVHDLPNNAGGAIDYFSSIGPTVEMTQKPQLSAPGGNILSTWPTAAGGYAVISGTSMAAPFAAACYALVKSQRPGLSVAQIVSLLQSTSVPLKALNSSILSSTAQQGAGIIDVYAAIVADSLLTPSQLNLRDSSAPPPQRITIENTSKLAKVYTVSHTGASYIRLLTDFTTGTASALLHFSLIHEAKYAEATFSVPSFKLEPGESLGLELQITAPANPVPVEQPAYSGYVKVQTDSSSYVVPYLGIPYSRYEANCIETNTKSALGVDTPSVTKSIDTPGEANIDTYNFLYLNGSAPPDLAFPLIYSWVSQPFNFYRLEAIPTTTCFNATYYGFDRHANIPTITPNMSSYVGFLGVKTYGVLLQFGIGEVPVDPRNVIPWISPYALNTFGWAYPILSAENGTTLVISSGDYRPLLRVLRWGGNLTNPNDYQSWLGPIVRANVDLGTGDAVI